MAATRKLLRCRHHTRLILTNLIHSSSSSSSSIQSHHLFTNTLSSSPRHHSLYSDPFFLGFYSYRSFSTHRGEGGGPKFTTTTATIDDNDNEISEKGGFFDYNYDYDVTTTTATSDVGFSGAVSGGGGGIEDAMLPVRCLVWFLDQIHHLTGLPWWIVIITSTLALRIAILPMLLVQLRKLKKHAELAPQLPPPLPPPFSGKSWIEQYKRFRDKRKEIGCPSMLWMLAYPSVQIPFFILGTASVRQMALDNYYGFQTGGTLWFQNLTELSHGASGYIFPLLIASLHLVNVRVSFEKSSLTMLPNLIGTLAKYYRFYLQCLTIPIFVAGFYLPQGSLIYWAANSTITLVQQLALKHPHVREKLGLPEKLAPVDSGNSSSMDGLEATFTVPVVKKPIQELSLLELFNLAIKHLSKGEQDRAVPLLRMALAKDPEYVRALIAMGQILIKDEKLVEATDYLERAVAKLLLVGYPTEVEEIDHLILASTWSGVALAKQGKVAEGIVHLERIANMKEPEDAKSKTHYCDGLLVLSSSLASVGRNEEAAKYLRILTTHDPAYGKYLKDVESEDNNFAGDLENSRRKDY